MRSVLLTLALALALVSTRAGAQRTDQRSAPANFDVRSDKSDAAAGYLARASVVPAAAVAALVEARASGLAQLQAGFNAVALESSPLTGALEVVRAAPGGAFLTGPTTNRVAALRGFLSKYAGAYGLAAAQVADLTLVSDYTNPAGNMGWVEFEQRLSGIPVFQGLVRGGFTAQGELVATTGLLAAGLDGSQLSSTPALSAAHAVSGAAASVGWTVAESALVQKGTDGDTVIFARGTMADDAKAWLVYFPLAPGVARLAWATEIWGNPEAFLVVTDAEDGTLLWRKNLTNYQTQSASYTVYNDDSPAPMSPSVVLPGSGTQASFIGRTTFSLIGNEAPNTFNNLGWMTDGANSTDGNNVQAGIDRDGINGVDAPVTGVARVFNFTYNPQVDEALTVPYQSGEVTDTFYWTNKYHDQLYLLGFTEAAGNFQNDNFGRGGVALDRVSAEAQDSSGTNNANFSTLPDGNRGRMQMYIFPGPAPDRSSGLDHDVLIHELTHGTSNRLHNNASGLSTTMAGGMGEGWSDFYARALLSTAGEDPNGIYSTGGWVTNLFIGGYVDNYYYGIRRFPYASISTLGINGKPHNPLTFADIDAAKIDTTDGAYPRSPVIGNTAFEVHNIGEVWASMLFEVRARFITRLGWATGNQRVLQFVTDGMKLDPAAPTFLQARDSILAAANAGGGTAADIADIWAGFAARGLGLSAQITSLTNSAVTVVEAFDVPGLNAGAGTLTSESIPNGRLDPSEAAGVSLCIVNNGGSTSGAVTGTLLATGGVTLPSGPQLYGAIAAGATVCRPFSFTVGASCGAALTATVQADETSGSTKNLTYAFQVGSLATYASQNFDGVVAPALPAGWTTSTLTGTPNLWVTSGTASDSAPNHAAAGNPVTVSDNVLVSPTIAIPAGGGQVSFRNSYNVEPTYDGGVLEISIGGGAFTDIITAGGTFVAGAYNGTVSTCCGNPLAGRSAWTGTSLGYVTTTVTLPAGASAQNIQLRWRVGTDGSLAASGWSVDTIVVSSSTYTCGGASPVTQAATGISQTGATLNATVNPNGAITTALFDYGQTTGYGTQATASPAPGSGVSPVPVSAVLGSLVCNTPYHFRVAASNANGTSTGADLTFTTSPCSGAPGSFGKSLPTNGAVGQSTSPPLNWGASSGATGYESCIDTTNNSACDAVWTSTGTNTSVGLSGLANGTPYYWHVRANNGGGTTYADGSNTAFWSFTTQAAATPDIRIQPTSLAFVPESTKTIYVELDWMEDVTHSHKPSQAVIDTVVATFAREGYTINIDVSNAIPHQAVLDVVGSPSGSASVQAIKAANFNHAGDSRYFYSIWAHNYSVSGAFTTSSGIADLPGNTHLVTLGSFASQTGTFSNQVGTFIHEFGHNIGQLHGGVDSANYKPNYLSVMNYHYQLNGLGPSLVALQFANTTSGFNTFAYSHGLLPALNEASLNENLGIGLGRARDWNCDSILSTSLARDIQASNPCAGAGGLSVLSDYDNWAAINAFVLGGARAPASIGQASEECVTAEEDLPLRTAIAALRAQGVLPDESTLMASSGASGAPSLAPTAQVFEAFNDGTATLNVTGISLDTPAAWVTWEPQTFSVPPGGSQLVQVYVDRTTIPFGQTTRRLLVTSNDPDESPYPNAVNLTMQGNAPGAFGKSVPTNGATGQSTSPTLSWGAASGATGYEYCIDTTNDNACGSAWTSTGTNTSVGLSSLTFNTTYYWHVRAINGGGTTYADGSSTAFWSFTTQTSGVPGVFGKSLPTNGATGQSTSPTLSWGAASGATGYQYCIDFTNDDACSGWTSTGTNTSVGLSGLLSTAAYYWHVRATNAGGTTYADGSPTAFWSFSTSQPGTFGKSLPANGVTGQSTSPTLSWGAAFGSAEYEYCIDTTNDSACGSAWTSAGTNTSVALSSLLNYTTYYWHARATNPGGTTYANGSPTAFWSFTTQLAADSFEPDNTAAQASLPTPGTPQAHTFHLNGDEDWVRFPVVLGQFYTIYTSGLSAGLDTVMELFGTDGVTSLAFDEGGTASRIVYTAQATGNYYVKVRGFTASNLGTYTLTLEPAGMPVAFGKVAPANGATGQSIRSILSWQASYGATGYEYCFDTSNDNTCGGWTSAGTNTSVMLPVLSNSQTYYWQARATNAGQTAYADGNATAFWSFTTAAAGTPPSVTTLDATNIQSATVTLNASVNPNGSVTTAFFDYGQTLGYGSQVVGTPSPGSGSSPVLSSATVSGLPCNTTYHFRGVAANGGSANGSDLTVTTAPCPAPGLVGSVQALAVDAIDGNLVYAGTTNGIYKTVNGGASWTRIDSGLFYTNITSLAIDPNAPCTIYAGAYTPTLSNHNDILAVTNNCGSTWGIATGAPSGTQIISIALTPANPSALFTAFERSDGGNSFSKPVARVTRVGGVTETVESIFFGSTVVATDPAGPCTAYVGFSGGTVFKNTACSGAMTWSAVGSSLGAAVKAIVVHPTNHSTLLAGTSDGHIYRKADDVSPWVTVATVPGSVNSLVYRPGSAQVVYAAGAGGALYASADGGDTWGPAAALGGSVAASGVSAAAANVVYAGGNSFVVKLVLGGPPAFSKTTPTNGAVSQSTSPTLSWGAAAGATGYEYCIDTTNDSACSTQWTSTGTNISVGLSGLAAGTTYYWQVRANNAGGTTYANGSNTAFWSFTTGANVVVNGDFGSGAAGWSTFGAPDSSYMESTIVNGVYEWRRVPQTPGQPVSQATIYQPTGVVLGAGVPVAATFDIGNTSSARKYMKVLLVGDANFTDLAACTFWLPPNTPLTTFAMRAHTTKAWANATIYFYASSPNTDNGYYLLDNVSMTYGGGQAVDRTECIDPHVPTPPGGAVGPNLLTNGDFGTGALAPWGTVGSVPTQIVGNVLEFYRGAAFPPPVIAQATGQAMTANQLITATFQLGNSSPVRKRALILLNDNDFSDLTACTFWLEPGTALATYAMTGWASKAWTNATVSIYPSTQYDAGTPANNPWIRIDNITLQRTPSVPTTGTTCLEPGAAAPVGAPEGARLPGVAEPARLQRVASGAPSSRAPSGAQSPAPERMGHDADAWGGDGFARVDGATGIDGGAVYEASVQVGDTAVLGPPSVIDLRDATRASVTFVSAARGTAARAVQVRIPDGPWMTIAGVPGGADVQTVVVDLDAYRGALIEVRLVLEGTGGADTADAVWRVSDLDVQVEP